MILAIDASNIGSSGGIVHIKELLNNTDLEKVSIEKVIIWGSRGLLAKIGTFDWLEKKHISWLDKSFLFRTFWQLFLRDSLVKKSSANVLFLPNASLSNFHPQVSMCQNQLPFEPKEIGKFWPGINYFRLILLKFQHSKSFRLADGIIFLSQYSHKRVEFVVGDVSKKSVVIPHGLSKIFKTHPKKKYSLGPKIKLLYVSRINLYKHQWVVAESALRLKRMGYNVELKLLGDQKGFGRDKLNRVFSSYKNYDDVVELVEEVTQDKLVQYYQESDIFIFASSCETFGMILLEAMGSGLPIICSDKSSMKSLLKDTGLYFDVNNTDSLIEKLILLIENEDLMKKYGRSAHQEALKYSWKETSGQTLEYLASVSKDLKRNRTNN